MSVTTDVFVMRRRLPTPQAWLAAIHAAGFEMDLDTDFTWDDVSGWLPCTYKGVEAGFELDVADAEELELFEDIGFTPEELEAIGNRDTIVTFTTRSEFRDLMVATLAAAVLCQMTDGLLCPSEPPFITGPEAIAWARDLIPDYEAEIAQQDSDDSD